MMLRDFLRAPKKLEKEETMSLVKTLTRIDNDGKLLLPTNIMKFAGFKDGDVVELRLANSGTKVMISKRRAGERISRSGTAARIMGRVRTYNR
ncbi:MAG TPA: hypothetical protein DIS73_00420 [Planctomycetia bacterium]|nr:MAG: hypothetical protein A3I59_08025 [Planctomycetes bacterium RIFCSPLOWO2_02_FULL_50_16]HCN18746.1 hypothetical protein [Planctomycetia bacterium]